MVLPKYSTGRVLVAALNVSSQLCSVATSRHIHGHGKKTGQGWYFENTVLNVPLASAYLQYVSTISFYVFPSHQYLGKKYIFQ